MEIQTKLNIVYTTITRHFRCGDFRIPSRRRVFSDKKRLFCYVAHATTNLPFREIAVFMGYTNVSSAMCANRTQIDLNKIYKDQKVLTDLLIQKVKQKIER